MRHAAVALLVSAAATVVPASPAAAQERRRVADPLGAAGWTAELRRSRATGEDCAVVRQGRAVRTRSCGALSSRTVFRYATLRRTGEVDPRRWRTVFAVTFARSVERATLTTADGRTTYRRGRGPRVLLAVLAGDVEQGLLRVRVRDGRGQRRTLTAGQAPGVTFADPLGGDGWRLASGDGRRCVAWERVRRFTRPVRTVRASGPERCASASGDDALRLAVADREDGRLVVTGVADEDARSVVLRTVAGSVQARRDPETGAFLAVLGRGVDPASVRVVVTLPGGRQATGPLEAGAG